MTAVSYDTALDWIRNHTRPGRPDRRPLGEIRGQILAEAIRAPFPLPRWRSSSMDGFAARRAEFSASPPPWQMLRAGITHAGDPSPPPLSPGTVWQVATGGQLPSNADCVIRVEDTTVEGDRVTIHRGRDLERPLREEGGDVAFCSTVLPAGTMIHPGTIGVLAALGADAPLVYPRPRILILASGNELVSAPSGDAVRRGDRIFDANTPMLAALVHLAGGVPIVIDALPDDPVLLTQVIKDATDVELILSAGGISVGPQDFIPAVMREMGIEPGFRRVRMRPGGPVTGARLHNRRLWLALPGNPISAWTTFLLLAQPAIRELMGDPYPGPIWSEMELGVALSRHPTLDLFVRVRAMGDEPAARVVPTGPQESWRTTALAVAERVARIPAGEGTLEAGAPVLVTAIGGG